MWTEETIRNVAWDYVNTTYLGVPYNTQLAEAFIAGAKFVINNTQN